MTRQYYLFTKTPSSEWSQLTPGADSDLYDWPEVWSAVEYLQSQQCAEGVAIRIGTRMFNVVVFEQEAIAPKAFEFGRNYRGTAATDEV